MAHIAQFCQFYISSNLALSKDPSSISILYFGIACIASILNLFLTLFAEILPPSQ